MFGVDLAVSLFAFRQKRRWVGEPFPVFLASARNWLPRLKRFGRKERGDAFLWLR
jgi:hypothetical protein